jgi:hypothetical protein
MVLRRELLPWGRPLLMGKLALFAATPGMVAGCCYVIDVTVDSIGIVLEKTDAGPLALRLVHNELLLLFKKGL